MTDQNTLQLSELVMAIGRMNDFGPNGEVKKLPKDDILDHAPTYGRVAKATDELDAFGRHKVYFGNGSEWLAVDDAVGLGTRAIDAEDIQNNRFRRNVKNGHRTRIAYRLDDGLDTQYTRFYDVFREYGFTGTVGIITNRIDSDQTSSYGTGYMTSDQVVEMHNDGWEMASHSHTHADLTTLSESELNTEFQTSIDKIEEWTGERPTGLIAPYNATNSTVIEVARTYFDWIQADGIGPSVFSETLPETQTYRTYGDIINSPGSYSAAPHPCVSDMHHNEDRIHVESEAKIAWKNNLNLTTISNLTSMSNLIGAEQRDMDNAHEWWKWGGDTSNISMDANNPYHGHDASVKFDPETTASNAFIYRRFLPAQESKEHSASVVLDLSSADYSASGAGITLRLEGYDADGNSVGQVDVDSITSSDAVSGWHRYSGSATVPSGSQHLRAKLDIVDMKGTIYASDYHVYGPT